MRGHKLSIEDHQKVAREILGIFDAHSRIIELISGKVPVRILDQLLTFRGVDKSTERLRTALEEELAQTHPGSALMDLYRPRGDRN